MCTVYIKDIYKMVLVQNFGLDLYLLYISVFNQPFRHGQYATQGQFLSEI